MLPEGLQIPKYVTNYRNLDVNATGALVRAGGVQVFLIVATNTTSGTLYLKLYDKATAATSSDTPDHTYPIPGNWVQPIEFTDPDYYALGLSVRGTTGIADSDNTGPTTNGLVLNLHYK